ncbi:MAG: hypothetical protein AAF363_02345 [Bacteroidota bacterium]
MSAQSSAPKFSNEFLSIGVGSRALSMSGVQTSFVDDVTSGFWNPAGLAHLNNKYEASFMHAEYFAGIAKFDYLSFATRIDTLTSVGFSAIRFGVDDIPDTRFLFDANGAIDYSQVRFFSSADYAFLFSVGRKIPTVPGLSAGLNFKVIYRQAGSFANAWGFGLDAGVQYRRDHWNLGLTVRDVTGTYNAWNHDIDEIAPVFAQTGNEIPENSIEITLPKALLEVSRSFDLPKELGLLVAIGADLTFDGKRNVLIEGDAVSVDPKLGLELDYKNMFFIRSGVGNVQRIKDFDGSTDFDYQPNFGVGVVIKKVKIDYALTDIGNQAESLYSHVFTISAGFN